MKKLLRSVLTLALVLCCFTFVGCDLFKDKDDTKPATIEQTLAICDQFIADMQAIQTKISAPDYEYPTTDAQASANQVSNISKSSIGIRYSNYIDFNINHEFNQEFGVPFQVLDEYIESVEDVEFIELFCNIYKSNNLSLNTVYSFDMDGTSYIKLTNDNSQICLTSTSIDNDSTFCISYIINLNSDLSWKSFETKSYDDGDGFGYGYIEKSTDENRIFDQYINGYIDGFKGEDDYGDVILSNFDESCQKMLFVHFHTQPTTNLQELSFNYIDGLNISTVVDNIDITNAVEIEVNLGE